MKNGKTVQKYGFFEFIGSIFRFPIFFLIVCLKLFFQFPAELIIFKICGSLLMFFIGALGFITSIFFSNREGLRKSKDTIKEVFELFFNFECFDFSETINFLKYGSFKKRN